MKNTIMKRFFLTFAVALMTALLISSCTTNNQNSVPEAAKCLVGLEKYQTKIDYSLDVWHRDHKHSCYIILERCKKTNNIQTISFVLKFLFFSFPILYYLLLLPRKKTVYDNVTRSYIHLHHIILHALRRISNNSAQRLHILAVS